MKVTILLGHAAVRHADDGTVSVLKAFLRDVRVDAVPVLFGGLVLVAFWADEGDPGPHTIEVLCRNDRGAEIMDRVLISGVPGGGAFTALTMRSSVHLDAFSRYTFAALVDTVERDSCTLDVRKRGS